jgi:hypothetical protein
MMVPSLTHHTAPLEHNAHKGSFLDREHIAAKHTRRTARARGLFWGKGQVSYCDQMAVSDQEALVLGRWACNLRQSIGNDKKRPKEIEFKCPELDCGHVFVYTREELALALP